MSAEIVSILRAARAWLGEGPHRWCQGIAGINSHGHRCDAINDLDAGSIRACAAGATAVACMALFGNLKQWNAALAALGAFGKQGIAPWNDAPERTYEEVLARFDRAIPAERTAP